MGSAMVSGKLGQESLADWESKSAEEIVKSFQEVRATVLAPIST